MEGGKVASKSVAKVIIPLNKTYMKGDLNNGKC